MPTTEHPLPGAVRDLMWSPVNTTVWALAGGVGAVGRGARRVTHARTRGVPNHVHTYPAPCTHRRLLSVSAIHGITPPQPPPLPPPPPTHFHYVCGIFNGAEQLTNA